MLVVHTFALPGVMHSSATERFVANARNEMPGEVFNFFYPGGTEWDAALDDSLIPSTSIPGPDKGAFKSGFQFSPV